MCGRSLYSGNMGRILEATLGRIAVIRDQFLGGAFIGAIIIGAMSLSMPAGGTAGVHRVIMNYIAVGLVLVGFSVYAYARFKGVSSEQEMAFQQQARDVLEDHKRKKSHRRRARNNRTT